VPGPPSSRFPDPRRAPGDAPVAAGGDLEPATLLDAYRHGIFPWPLDEGHGPAPLLWWSPDPRAVIPLDGLHVSRTLARTLRRGVFACAVDTDFDAVVAYCADRPGEGTWITPAMASAYGRLHRLGAAHSVEVRDGGGALVGGVYGVTVGAAFCAESMFSRATDASKVALVALVAQLRADGFALLDAQLPTPHLKRMGAVALPRDVYLRRLSAAVDRPARFAAAGGALAAAGLAPG